MYIKAATLDDLMRRVLGKLVKSSERYKATRGWFTEMRGVLLRLMNPRARLSHTERKGKIFSALGELMRYLTLKQA
jgi:thymidylate synthase